ncbi:tetratricopeptide (TPR) repeat protein [Thermonema lapsum]|uniref:Tetratricopeptide (TPR) repeat protein n=1 Tax=Thermonema lapsum TaxID=28195 RepID=A0A846MND5_9BACT|nr:tetratricopeptide repeat protein [Thermonema lapsum]NIK73056.1 tetratricopeptide (TPR) repeat protein [Thermonema lapsum]
MKCCYFLPLLLFACLALWACEDYEASDDRMYGVPNEAAIGNVKIKELLEEAAEEEPSAYVYTKLAQWVWHNERRLPLALSYTSQALRLDSTYAWAWYLRGRLLLEQKKPQEALIALEKARDYGYADAALWLSLGEGYRRTGDSARCMQALLEARRRLPYSPLTFLALGKAYFQFGAPAEAEQALRTALAKEPRQVEGYYFLLKTWEAQDKQQEVDSLLARALRRLPASDTLWYYHAQRLAGKRMTDSALVCYRKTLQLNPLHVAARYQLAEQLTLRYAWDEACEHFRYLANHDQLPARTAYYLGLCAIKAKEYEEAVEWLERAVKINPGDTQAKSYLYYARSLRDGTWVPPAQDSTRATGSETEILRTPIVPSVEMPKPKIQLPALSKDTLP